jgi:hemolysin III
MVEGISSAALAYDARRDLFYSKPAWRGWTHLVCFVASLAGGVFLILTVRGAHRTGAATYAATVSGLFGASALYHRGNWRPRLRRLLQRVDHTMIFLLIAGTATPVFLVAVPGFLGRSMLAAIWALTGSAMLTHLIWMSAPEMLMGATFVALGSLGGVALPFIWIRAGVAAFVLFLAGGLVYLLGALLYHHRWPDPRPTVFGYHEVFHACVCVAAAAHYAAIALFVV